LEIKYIPPPGSTQSIIGVRSSATVSQLIMEMADADDGRIPIVRRKAAYEGEAVR